MQYRLSGATLAPVGGPYAFTSQYATRISAPQQSAASGFAHAIAEASRDVLVRFDLVDEVRVCSPATPNGIGQSVTLEAAGSGLAGDALHLRAVGFDPNGMTGYWLTAPALTAPFPVAGGVATPLGPVALQPGDLWCFQTWYRDRLGSTATSNTSDALRVTLR